MRDDEKPKSARDAFAFSTEIVPASSAQRDEWPKGLRVLRWLSVLGLVLATVQLFHFIVNRGELGPPITFQGSHALANYVLTVAAVVTGLRWKRRPFVLILFASCVTHSFVTSFYVMSMVSGWNEEQRTTSLSVREVLVRDAPYLLWNLCVIGLALVVLRYLLSNHVRVVGSGAS